MFFLLGLAKRQMILFNIKINNTILSILLRCPYVSRRQRTLVWRPLNIYLICLVLNAYSKALRVKIVFKLNSKCKIC